MLIDWHANLWLTSHFNQGDDEFTSRVAGTGDASPEAFEQQVIPDVDQFVVVTMFFPTMGLTVPNEFTAEFVAKHKDKAKGFACVDPMDEKADSQLEYAIREEFQ